MWCDHNCHNVHNCRYQPQRSQHQSWLSHKTTIATTIVAICSTTRSQFFKKNFDLVNVYTLLKDDASLSALNLDSIFHNIVLIFWPANLLQYILEAYNFVLRANLAVFMCKAYRFITIFAISVARRNILKILTKIHAERFCNWACRSQQVFRFMPKNIIIA